MHDTISQFFFATKCLKHFSILAICSNIFLMKKETRRLVGEISAAAIASLVAISPLVASQVLFNKFFNTRIESYAPLWYDVSDFAGLQRTKHVFASDKGQKLTGYMYYSDAVSSQKGVIILSHGYGGGGQRTYMDCTNYLCSHGYYVFAYDNTGNDESEGEGIIGFPQGIIDLHNAINYVKGLEKYKSYPLMLFGHSWGGYSTTNVLYYHPEIKAVVALSGFNQSSLLIKSHGLRYAPSSVDVLMPYVSNYEQAKFGKLTESTAMRSFEKTKAKVFIAHSKDDNVVPYEAGFGVYFEKYSSDPRFTFESYNYRGHGAVYYSDEGREYTEIFQKDWKQFLKSDPSETEKQKYLSEHLDRTIWNNRLDTNLFARIIDFYNQNL